MRVPAGYPRAVKPLVLLAPLVLAMSSCPATEPGPTPGYCPEPLESLAGLCPAAFREDLVCQAMRDRHHFELVRYECPGFIYLHIETTLERQIECFYDDAGLLVGVLDCVGPGRCETTRNWCAGGGRVGLKCSQERARAQKTVLCTAAPDAASD